MNRSHLTAWVLTVTSLSALCAQPIAAQVIPDATLPAGERSQVTGNPNVQIDGGARRGGNLFHSFSQFSISTGGSAYFNNAADVQNIFSRVTGGSISNINGLIRANGTANLFLLNPNGILFGPNASLNIGGSFVATTANAIGFPNGEMFSSDATKPLLSQLLTVNPNAFFFNQLTPKPIVVQSRFDEAVFTGSSFNATGLHVLPGKNLLLVGGPIQLASGEPFISANPPGRPLLRFFSSSIQDVQPDGGWLISPGSDVELGAVGGIGTVGLSTVNSDWQLTIPNAVPRANISLSNGSGIYVIGASGSIRMLAQSIDISKSYLGIGIPRDSRLPNTQTGDLDLNATGSITLSMSLWENNLAGQGTLGSSNLTASDRVFLDLAVIYGGIGSTGVGSVGNINITTGSLFLTNRAIVQSYTQGQGRAGSININARNIISLDNSYVYNISRTGVDNAGDINIATESLSFTNNAQLVSFQSGPSSNLGSININARSNSGSININARDTVSFTQNSGLASYVNGSGNAGSINVNAYNAVSLDRSSITNTVLFGTGKIGGINITTGSLSLTHASQLFSSTLGQGNAGSVTINTRDRVSVDGDFTEYTNSGRIIRYKPSRIITQVAANSEGQGGDVSISTDSLFLTNGGAVNTSTEGRGNAGRVLIKARESVQISGTASNCSDCRSGVLTSTQPRAVGNAGDIDITARSLSVLNNGQLSASTSSNENAGNITVSADTISVSSGGQLLTTTFSSGNAGNITVKTPDLQLSGATSGLFAQTTSTGNAGNLTIQPRGNGQSVRVNLQDGAQISASTSSSGRGGDLTIAAPDSITLTGNGSVIAAGTGGSGDGGNLNLRTRNLNIQNQAEVTVSSSGTGSAGNLFVDANRIFLNNQGSIRADTTGGGGNINLRSPLILLRNGSNITTNATGANIPGGNIAIDTRFLVAVLKEDSNISANSEDFRGGNVRINAFSIFGIRPSPVSTPLSDITATGATAALPGTIDVITSGFDPTAGLVALPTDLVDSSGLIAQGCPANQGNSFVITGRGGLPPTPEQQLDDDAKWSDRRRLVVAGEGRRQETEGRRSSRGGRGDTETRRRGDSQNPELKLQTSNLPDTPHPTPPHPISPTPQTPILEATGWQTTSTGEVFLVGTTPAPTVENPLKQPVACQGGQ
ncbi:MAG: filamentous hemagglutinin N-terminal domain-containing protein [Lyngbya sp. HA4199-MV5]|jgi:filamentous hemagglutinin family protein|nr:filamentous hemagglutinin N-terminal domain-containing protein [Lyngbya sp. HA4199-MV5]